VREERREEAAKSCRRDLEEGQQGREENQEEGRQRTQGEVVPDTTRSSNLLLPGAFAALVTLVLDQATKYWLLHGLDLAHRGVVRVTPFFDLVLAWNIGISFGWFQNDSAAAQTVLMLVKAVAVIALGIWMARSRTMLATIALGLIIGGAIGNA